MVVEKKIDKNNILEFLVSHKEELAGFGVYSIGLFGSFARGEEREDSDIDFFVQFDKEKKNYDNFLGLIEYLETVFGKEVELVTRASVSEFIWPYIEKEVEYVQISN
jgi:predicted nucleotidyltransferase